MIEWISATAIGSWNLDVPFGHPGRCASVKECTFVNKTEKEKKRNKKVWPLGRSISVAEWFPETLDKSNCKAIKRLPHLLSSVPTPELDACFLFIIFLTTVTQNWFKHSKKSYLQSQCHSEFTLCSSLPFSAKFRMNNSCTIFWDQKNPDFLFPEFTSKSCRKAPLSARYWVKYPTQMNINIYCIIIPTQSAWTFR